MADYPETVNINYEPKQSAYRLRRAPTQLTAKVTKFDGDGKVAEIQEVVVEERHRTLAKLRGSRKQRAAHAMIPTASIHKVSDSVPVKREVAIAIYEGGNEEDIKVAELEARIRELRAMLIRPNPAPMPGKPEVALDHLLKAFEQKHIK